MPTEERFQSGSSVGISYGLQSFVFFMRTMQNHLLAASIIHHKKQGTACITAIQSPSKIREL